MVLLDTSVLIDGLTGPRDSGPALLRVFESGERIGVPSLVIYEWLRGPRTESEIEDQERLIPAAFALPFNAEDARLSAELYRSVRRGRTREIDIGIAASAIRREAELWTLNRADFADIPGLRFFVLR
ncbi:MAG TPA: PIN domain-containing protein [Bryobacteraceae bacterium]|nr:PIN domain-containing protein [Bryobacteraceae bacterium]